MKYIFLIIIFSVVPLFATEKLQISTVDLDHHFKINKELRKEFIRILNRYPYLEDRKTITVDIMKDKLFSTNDLNIENGIEVASNLNTKVAILFNAEKILLSNNMPTNNNIVMSNSNDNIITTNNMSSSTNTDYSALLSSINSSLIIKTNDFSSNKDIKDKKEEVSDNQTSTNESATNIISNLIESSLESSTTNNINMYDYNYNFSIINVDTKEVLKEYTNVASNNVINEFQNISRFLDYYYAAETLDSIESYDNDIRLDFIIERISLENKTNALYSDGSILQGESFNLKFRSNKSGYLYILALQNNGNIIIMFPNDFNNYLYNNNVEKDEFIEEYTTYVIPPDNAIFKIVVSSFFEDTTDKFYAIYTKDKIDFGVAKFCNGDGFRLCDKSVVSDFATKLLLRLKLVAPSDYQVSKISLKALKATVENQKRLEISNNSKILFINL